MKSHKFKLHFQVHRINLNLSFPCKFRANLCIDYDQHNLFDKIDKQQAKQQISQQFSTQISMLFNPRTSQYSIKKCIITFSAITKSNNIPLGSTSLFLNKQIQPIYHSTVQINKCSDKSASFQYSLSLSFLQQSQVSHDNLHLHNIRNSFLIQQSDKKLSIQVKKHNLSTILSSSLILSPGKLLFDKEKLYKSIVQEEDIEIQQSDQSLINQKKKDNQQNQNKQLVNQISLISYEQINSPRLTGKSRISNTRRISQRNKLSYHENINKNYLNNNDSNINNSRISTTRTPHRCNTINFLSSPTSPRNKLRTNTYFQPQESTNKFSIISVQQKKLQHFQHQTELLQKQNNELKSQIKKQKQINDNELFKQKQYIEKLQIQQNNMRSQLIKIKEKCTKMEKQFKEIFYDKNQLLNNLSNTNKEHQIIGQLRNKQVFYEKQQIKLLDRINSLNKIIQQKQIKIINLQSQNKQQQNHINSLIKESQYYRKQFVSLEQKVQQAKFIEEKLKLELQQSQNLLLEQKQLAIKYKRQLNQAKCLINNTQIIQNRQIQSLRQQLQQKHTQISLFRTQLIQKTFTLTSELQQLKLHNSNLNQQIKQINSNHLHDIQSLHNLQHLYQQLSDKLLQLQQSSSSQLQQKSQQISILLTKLQHHKNQLYHQQQINFDLEQKIQQLQQKIINKNQQIQILSNSLLKLSNQFEKIKKQQKNKLNLLEKDTNSILIQLDNKNKELIKCDHIIQDLKRKYQELKNINNENIQKFHKCNQDNIEKNKEIIYQQNLLNQKGNEMYTIKIKANDLQIQNSRLKRQTEQNLKKIKYQQDQITKLNQMLNNQHQKMNNKQQQLKQTLKQLKILQGQIFTYQKKIRTILKIQDSQCQYQLKTPLIKHTRTYSNSTEKQNYYQKNLLKQHTNDNQNDQNYHNNHHNQNNIIIQSNKQNRI